MRRGLAESEDFIEPEDIAPVDDFLFREAVRNFGRVDQDAVRLAYSLIECWCASVLEARVGIQLCILFHVNGGDADEVRDFIRPQYPVGWCKLDFLVAPYRNSPHIAFAIECDGEHWHNAEKDARRDGWIKANDDVVKEIYRFPGAAIRSNASGLVWNALRDFRQKYETHETGKPFA